MLSGSPIGRNEQAGSDSDSEGTLLGSSDASASDARHSAEPARVAELSSFLKNLQGFKAEEPGSPEAVALLAFARSLCVQIELHRSLVKQQGREDSDRFWHNKAINSADVLNVYYKLWKARGDKEFATLEQTKEVLKAHADGREWSKVSTHSDTKITELTHKPYEIWSERRRSEQQDLAFADMALGDILFFNFYFYNKIQVKAGSDKKPNSAKPSEQENIAAKDAYMSSTGSRRRVGST